MKLKSVVSSVAVASVLAACGGGGNSSNNNGNTPGATVQSNVSTASFPIEAAASTFEQTAHSFPLSGTDSTGAAYTATFANMPDSGTTTFEGHTASSMVTTTTLSRNNVVIDTSSSRGYFQTSPYIELGQADLGDALYYVDDVTAPLHMPTTATVGQSGQLNDTTIYVDSSKAQVMGHQTNTWSLEADTVSTALLCNTGVYTSVSSSLDNFTEKQCLRINTSGTVLGLTVAITSSVLTLTLQ